MGDPFATIARPLPQGGADPFASIARTGSPQSTPFPPTKPGNIFTSGHPLDTLKANVAEGQQGAQAGDGRMMGALKNFGAGGADVVHSLGHSILHPVDTISSSLDEEKAQSAKPITQQLKDEVTSGRILGMGGEGIVSAAKGMLHAPMRTMGQIGTGAIIGGATGEGVGAAANAGSAMRTAAIGDTDAAALRGMRIPPNGKKVLPMQSSVQNARPFLQGSDSLEDLQSRIKPAQKEVFSPYRETLEHEGDNPIQHPDGSMTTIRELENERKQLSAMNRGLKTGDPAALQLAQQKGLSQAEALAREKSIQGVLDPALSKFGIDPQGIRQAYGSVARVGNQVSGRSTLLEKPQPYGFAKVVNPFELAKGVELTKPSTYVKPLSNLMDAGKDVTAGRYWTGSPSDVGIREGFANAGPKPDFGHYTPFQPTGLLGKPPIELGASPERGGVPEGYRPPPFYHDTDAMRTGRLLNAPPIELPGSIHPEVQSTFRHDTTPMRFGNILNAPLQGNELPSSYHTEEFPDQLPSGTRLRPKVIEGKK